MHRTTNLEFLLQDAKAVIYEPIKEHIAMRKEKPKDDGPIEVYLQWVRKSILVVGQHLFFIPDTDETQIEDYLFVLQKFHFILSFEKVCGPVYQVKLILDRPVKENKLISINKGGKKAA